MKRAMFFAVLMLLVPMLTASQALAGGAAAGLPCTSCKVTGPAINAIVDISFGQWTGTQGTFAIRISKGGLVAGVVDDSFVISQFTRGCDGNQTTPPIPLGTNTVLKNTTDRFVNHELSEFFSSDSLVALFTALNITVTPAFSTTATNVPIFTDVDSAVCVNDAATGTLSFNAVVQFLNPK
jgi:hypothetical protein